MKISTLGIILAAKNLGTWLATLSLTNVRDDPALFGWLFLIYALVNIPTDLYLANHLSELNTKKEKK